MVKRSDYKVEISYSTCGSTDTEDLLKAQLCMHDVFVHSEQTDGQRFIKRNAKNQLTHVMAPFEDLHLNGLLSNQPAIKHLALYSSHHLGGTDQELVILNQQFNGVNLALETFNVQFYSIRLAELLSQATGLNSFVKQAKSKINVWCYDLQLNY